VLIPCFNEATTIEKVVRDFQTFLPGADIYVFNNDSTDNTASVAEQAGAEVIFSPRRGKGRVIRHAFEKIDADVYLVVDGDDTYPASVAETLITELQKGHADMIVGTRRSIHDLAYRRFHQFGNNVVAFLISHLFSLEITDVMSGYRALSREFVKTVPLRSAGFEIETELTLQAAARDFVIKEIPVPYTSRPQGSFSKLDTVSDGFLVLKAIFIIFKDYKPFLFFSLLSLLFLLVAIGAGAPPVIEYFKTGFVYRLPLAVLASGNAILAALSFSIGLILDTLSKYHIENFQVLRRLSKK
jgi:glycosyltransferase involved in cell wall biosynthesis